MIKAMVTGRLGKNAEVKTLDGGRSVINFNVATDQGYGDKKKTLWVECAYFTDKTGVVPYLLKGTQVAVFGEPSLRTWEANGKNGASFTLNVAQVELVGGKTEGDATPVATTETHQELAPRYPVANDLPF
jgi:single-strand DNA-binding protein